MRKRIITITCICTGVVVLLLAALLMSDSLIQPLLAALIGLIPNCAASIVLTKLFLAGTLSFGALAAGLSAGAGVGFLVLFRVNPRMKQNFVLLGAVWLLSSAMGVVLQLFF